MSTVERKKCLVTLGLSESATEDDIKKAYKKMALLYHPDKNGSEDAKGKFQEIGYAYKYLIDGPSAFETTNPHDVREEFLRRMFEEMFYAQFHSPFTFFCNDSDEDDYYIYHDSSDDGDDYNGSYGTNFANGHTRRTFQNTYTRQTPLHQNYPQLSKKQIRKREKRQRQRERAKEKKEQGRKEKKENRESREAKNVYSEDINPEHKQKENKTEPAAAENHNKNSSDKSDTGNSRPETPVQNQQPQKSNKKLKKKMESEQRKREKEMEEIAAELKKKHEREMEKQKEKERIAAQKREEEKENGINFSHIFDTGKKSRKARQREKKRQESGVAAVQRDNSSSSVQSDKPLHHVNTNTNSTSSEKVKPQVGASISKTQEPKSMRGKPAMTGNRYDVLDDIDDDITRPLSRTSISSNDSLKNSSTYSKHFIPSSRGKQNYISFQGDGVNRRSENNGLFRWGAYQNTKMNQNNSNDLSNFSSPYTHNERDMRGDNEEYARYGEELKIDENRTNVTSKFKGRNETLPLNRKNSFGKSSGCTEFEGGEERHFVEDWSEDVVEGEDDINNVWSNYDPSQFTDSQIGAQHGYDKNTVQDKIGNGYNGRNEARGGTYQPQGYQKRKEFIPRTRGYHGTFDNGSYLYGTKNGFPPYTLGSAPFTRGGRGMFHHQPSHLRGSYPGMPPYRGRNGGYAGPRYGPPVGMPGYNYGHPFHSSTHMSGSFYARAGSIHSDMNRSKDWEGNKRKQFTPKKSSNNNFKNNHCAAEEHIQNECKSDTVKSNETSGLGMSSQQFMSWQNIKDSDEKNPLTDNIFSNLGNNQASSGGSLDSLDDIVAYETNKGSDNLNVGTSTPSKSFPDSSVDVGMSEYLSKDRLGVPCGMFTDNIKNYYR